MRFQRHLSGLWLQAKPEGGPLMGGGNQVGLNRAIFASKACAGTPKYA